MVAAFCLAALVMALVPGPDLLFITATGLASGPRAGVLAALGMSAGLAVHTTAAAFGLGALLHTFPTAFTVVRILGAVYLAYFAVGSFLAAARKDAADPGRERAEQRLSARLVFGSALLTNLANAKVIAFFPQFIDPAQGHVMAQFFVLGALFILIGLSVDASAGLLAGRLGDVVRSRSSVQRWLHCLSGTVFGALAVRLATDNR